MAVIDLFKIIELKKNILDKYNVVLHIHDACSGQYFSFDEPNNDVYNFVTEYLKSEKYNAVFSDDKKSFHIEEIKSC